MQGENYQDGYSTRVRHVPIQVESRGGPTTRGYQQRPSSGDQANNQSSRFNNEQTSGHYNGGSSQNAHHNDRTYSPSNTSSINIDYKPPTSQRRPNTNNQAGENVFNNGGHETFSSGHHDDNWGQSPREHVGQQTKRAARASSKNRQQQPSNNPSTSSDKLVSSPEPIPLPPPPPSDYNQQQQHRHNDNNNHLPHSQQQPQQSKGSSVSPDIRMGENSSPHMKDGHASPQQKGSGQQQGQQQTEKDASVLGKINSIKEKLKSLLQDILEFKEISDKSPEYLKLDGMLERCILNLDKVECGDTELRQKRKAAIQLAQTATGILQRKLQVNLDIYDLSKNMSVPS